MALENPEGLDAGPFRARHGMAGKVHFPARWRQADMERSVTDPSIGRVLLICNKAYAEKANSRKDGVGDETMVISPEVYAKATETKYVPIIFERDENGKEYVPAYLKSRIHIDLCIDNPKYEEEYDKLLRNLHNEPENRKPALGKKPEWLKSETVSFSTIRNQLQYVRSYDGKNKNKIEYTIQKFNDEFISALLSFAPANDDEFDKNLLGQIDAAKPLRDLFFDYVDALMTTDLCIGDVLGCFFEKTYNASYDIKDRKAYCDHEFEFALFILWEMLVGTTAILLHYEKYSDLNFMLCRTYFLTRGPYNVGVEAKTFRDFRHYPKYIEDHIKPKSEKKNLFTLAGEIAIKREKMPILSRHSIANADVILFQLSCVYDFPGDPNYTFWFPRLYIYISNGYFHGQPIWSKMVSLRHCQKLYPLFGVNSIEGLKEMIAKSKPIKNVCYQGSFDSAPSIQDSITTDKIGTMP